MEMIKSMFMFCVVNIVLVQRIARKSEVFSHCDLGKGSASSMISFKLSTSIYVFCNLFLS